MGENDPMVARIVGLETENHTINAALDRLLEDVAAMRAELSTVRLTLATANGGLKTLIWIGSVAGGVLGLVAAWREFRHD